MKRLKKWMETGMGAWTGWVLAAICAVTALPYLVKVVLLFTAKRSLWVSAPLLVDVLCMLGGVFLLLFAVRDKKNIGTFLMTGCLPYLTAVNGVALIVDYLVGSGRASVLVWLTIIPGCAVQAAAVDNMAASASGAPAHRWRDVRWLGTFAAVAVIMGVLRYGLQPLADFLTGKLFGEAATLPAALTNHLIDALVWYAAILLAVALCLNFDRGAASSEERAVPGGKPVCAAVCAVAWVFILIFNRGVSREPLEVFRQHYTVLAATALADMDSGDYVIANRDYGEFTNELDAWESAVNGDRVVLERLCRENSNNVTLAYLKAIGAAQKKEASEITGDNVKRLEELYLSGVFYNADFLFTMLDVYRQQEKLKPEQENRRREMLTALAVSECWSGGLVTPQELSRAGEAFAETLKTLRDSVGRMKYIEILARAQLGTSYGDSVQEALGFRKTVLGKALQDAMQNPDDLGYQYMAVYAAANAPLTLSLISEYRASVLNAVERLDRLWESQPEDVLKEFEATDDIRLAEKRLIVDAYMNLRDTEKAADAALEALKSHDDYTLKRNAMYCLQDCGRTAECREIAERLLEKDGGDLCAIFYLGKAAAKEKDMGVVLDCLEKLAGAAQEEADPSYADDCLNQLLATVMIYENNEHDKLFGCYDKFDAAQLERIGKNRFLSAYVEVYDIVYNHGDSRRTMDAELISRAEAGVKALLEIREDLGYPRYLLGALYFYLEEYGKAAEAFEDALADEENDGIIWYSLFDAYDHDGEPRKAYRALTRASSLLPWPDYYGVSDDGLPHVADYKKKTLQQIRKIHEELGARIFQGKGE